MRKMMVAASAVGMIAATPAFAQAASGDVNSYLCTFAGKCGDQAATEDAPTIAAPKTKGFRIATGGAAAAPTMAAPTTRGFRVNGSTPAAPTVSAPNTRGFRINSGVTPAPVAATAPTRQVRVARPTARRLTPVARPAATPGAARADLMLTFEYNSAQMTSAAETRARAFAQALMMDELKSKRFMIEGHTDSRGSRDANIDLSRRRAQTVADFLVAQGVDRSRVEVKGVGPDEPLPGRSAMSESNRRVEAVLLS